MGIQRLTVRGFRSLREVEWRPGRLNVLIGPNASGKSNLLRAIALLQKSAQGELSQEILRMGGIAPLLWDGQTQELAWSVKTDPLDDGRDRSRAAHWADGATQLTTVDGEELRRWLAEYSLGALFRSGELEGMAL